MNATELYLKDGRTAGVWFCQKCKFVYLEQIQAERCCPNYPCSTCGKDTGGRSWLVCEPCRKAGEEAKERARFDKAEKITNWDGWVYLDGTGRDGYSESLEAFVEDWESDHEASEPLPEYVWACKPTAFVKVDLDRILENIAENGYEDFDASTLDGLDELKAAIKKFEDTNVGVLSWEPDYSKAVLIKKE